MRTLREQPSTCLIKRHSVTAKHVYLILSSLQSFPKVLRNVLCNFSVLFSVLRSVFTDSLFQFFFDIFLLVSPILNQSKTKLVWEAEDSKKSRGDKLHVGASCLLFHSLRSLKSQFEDVITNPGVNDPTRKTQNISLFVAKVNS